MNKNPWVKTVPYKISSKDVPGVYSATTESGRKIYSYSISPEDAYNSIINSISHSDKLLSIGRESI